MGSTTRRPQAQSRRAAAPAERLATLGGENDPAVDGPVIRDRQANAVDPSGVTANLSDRNRTGGEN